MITVINSDNTALYKNLFLEAEDLLRGYRSVNVFNTEKTFYIKTGKNTFTELVPDEGEKLIDKFFNTLNGDKESGIPAQKVYEKTNKTPIESGSITSLEEYFHWLPLLLDTDAQGRKIPNKFTILPLDEKPFEINANTRSIEIPDAFKKNGIAVQGDDLAEIVYFKIDRFFDAMDLNNCNILIQWETPKGTNGVVKGVSEEYVRDIESEPGKLIFGWALDKNITHTSGKLKFSVKFYNLEEIEKEGQTTKVIVYSFNTLTANVTIHPSIGLNIEDKESYIVSENAAQNLLERLEQSVIAGSGKAEIPVFLDYPYGDGNITENSYDVNEETGELNLYVLAYAPDTGDISYDWRMKYLDENNNITENITTCKYNSEFDYIKVDIKKLKNDPNAKHRLMYYKIDDNFVEAGMTGQDVIEEYDSALDTNILPAYYELKGKFVATEPGVYLVRAKNRIANSLTSVLSTDFGSDKVVKLYYPEPVIINEDKTEGYILGVDSLTVQFNEYYDDKQERPIPGKITYQWFKADTTDSGEILGEYVAINEAEDVVFVPEEEGCYKVSVTRFRNNAKKVSESVEYRVTTKTEPPKLSTEPKEVRMAENDLINFEIELDPTIKSDKYIVIIMREHIVDGVDKDFAVKTIEGKLPESGKFEINPNDFMPAIEQHNLENNESLQIDGLYYAIITNVRNSVSAEMCTWTPKEEELLSWTIYDL